MALPLDPSRDAPAQPTALMSSQLNLLSLLGRREFPVSTESLIKSRHPTNKAPIGIPYIPLAGLVQAKEGEDFMVFEPPRPPTLKELVRQGSIFGRLDANRPSGRAVTFRASSPIDVDEDAGRDLDAERASTPHPLRGHGGVELVEKPSGEVGRPGRAGYNIDEQLAQMSKDHKRMKVIHARFLRDIF